MIFIRHGLPYVFEGPERVSAEGQNFLGVFRKKGKGITKKSPKQHYLPPARTPYSNPIPKSYEVVCAYTCLVITEICPLWLSGLATHMLKVNVNRGRGAIC